MEGLLERCGGCGQPYGIQRIIVGNASDGHPVHPIFLCNPCFDIEKTMVAVEREMRGEA